MGDQEYLDTEEEQLSTTFMVSRSFSYYVPNFLRILGLSFLP